MLSDLTKVLDQGLQHDLDLEQIQRKYNALSAQKAGARAPKNKLEAKQAALAADEKLDVLRKNLDFFEHDRQTKALLKKQKVEQEKQQKAAAEKAIEQARKQMLVDERKQVAKEAYYRSIQARYEASTLPTIMESGAQR